MKNSHFLPTFLVISTLAAVVISTLAKPSDEQDEPSFTSFGEKIAAKTSPKNVNKSNLFTNSYF